MNPRDLMQLIQKLSGTESAISIQKLYVQMCSSLNEAAFLSEVVYWSGVNEGDNFGWFYRHQGEWHDKFKLSSYQLRIITEYFKAQGVIETELRKVDGAPVKHFRLNRGGFEKWIVEKLHIPLLSFSRVDCEETEQSLPYYSVVINTELTASNEERICPSEENFVSDIQDLPSVTIDIKKVCTEYKKLHGGDRWEKMNAFRRWLTERQGQYTTEQVISAMRTFFRDEYWRKEGFPTGPFAKRFAKYLSDAENEASDDAEAINAELATLPPPKRPATPQIAPNEEKQIPALQKIDLVARYREAVPHGPKMEHVSKPDQNKIDALSQTDPQVLEKYELILEKAEWVHKNLDPSQNADWLGFRYIFFKGGWAPLLSDDYDYLTRPKNGKSKHVSVIDELLEEMRAK